MSDHDDPTIEDAEAPPPRDPCTACGGAMRFEEGKVTHDLYAEKFVCSACGRVEYRSYGRGSV